MSILDRMIELATELAGKSQKVHHITLWWGEDGLELQSDDSIKQVKHSTKLNSSQTHRQFLLDMVGHSQYPQMSSLASRTPTPIFGSCPGHGSYQQTLVSSGYDPLTAQINVAISAQSMAIATQMAAVTAPITACCVEMEKAFQQQTNMIFGGERNGR